MKLHLFRRSVFAALLPVGMMILWGSPMLAAVFSAPALPLLLLATGVVFGAFLGALPRRIRMRHAVRPRPAWQRCVTAFAGGLLMMLAVRIGSLDDLQLAAGVMQGSVGALAFAAAAWLAACLTARIMGRAGL